MLSFHFEQQVSSCFRNRAVIRTKDGGNNVTSPQPIQRFFSVSAILVFLVVWGTTSMRAQSAGSDQKGITAFEEFRGSTSNFGQLLTLDTNLGYDFNRFAGIDVGVPVFFARGAIAKEFVTGRPNRWQGRLGDPYLDLRFTAENRVLNYASVITASAPVSHAGEFSTGRLGAEWFNHFDHAFGRLTPFIDASVANGVLNTRLLSQPFRLDRPFRTLGFLANFEAGSDLRIWHSFGVGAAAYQFAPAGRQQFFGSLTGNSSPSGVAATAQILEQFTHDRGYSAWVRLDPGRYVYTEVGYDHSIRLRQNSATFTLGFNLTSLFRRPPVRH
jgi:hypothetical protein